MTEFSIFSIFGLRRNEKLWPQNWIFATPFKCEGRPKPHFRAPGGPRRPPRATPKILSKFCIFCTFPGGPRMAPPLWRPGARDPRKIDFLPFFPIFRHFFRIFPGFRGPQGNYPGLGPPQNPKKPHFWAKIRHCAVYQEPPGTPPEGGPGPPPAPGPGRGRARGAGRGAGAPGGCPGARDRPRSPGNRCSRESGAPGLVGTTYGPSLIDEHHCRRRCHRPS